MMAKGEWSIGPVWVLSKEGWRETAGWYNGVFGLDWRTAFDDDGDSIRQYAITHLATGYSVASVTGSLEEAQQFADALAKHDVWNFTEPTAALALAGETFTAERKLFVENHTCDVLRGNSGLPPAMAVREIRPTQLAA